MSRVLYGLALLFYLAETARSTFSGAFKMQVAPHIRLEMLVPSRSGQGGNWMV